VMHRCLQFGTIMVMHSGNHWNKLGSLALAAVEELQIPTNNTIFITGANRQISLNLHSDNHNVLILQTVGSKRWKVWDPPVRKRGPDPLARGKNHDSIDPQELGELLLDVDLQPGQALCVPLGFPHITDTLASPDSPSLHITLSMYPTPTYASLRQELLGHLGLPSGVIDEDLSEELYWKLTSFVPVGCLAPAQACQAHNPGEVLGNLVATELCEYVAAAEPHRFVAGSPELFAHARAVVAASLRGLVYTLEAYANGFRIVAGANGEFPVCSPVDLVHAFNCGHKPRERRRLDPEDGVYRTWSEVLQRYSNSYDTEAIEHYWRDHCRPAEAAKTGCDAHSGEPARIDPADGLARTLSDLRHIHRLSWAHDEIEHY